MQQDTIAIDGVEYVRPYGCYDRSFEGPCHYHLERPKQRLDPRCQGCRHQLKPWREMGRAKVEEVFQLRLAAKVDENQRIIVQALRQAGASVLSLAAVGKGVPDLLVGFRGQALLVEIKDGKKIPSKQKLTPAQRKFIAEWRGQVRVVTNVDEALKTLMEIR